MNQTTQLDINRRDFLRGSSAATLMMMMGGVPLNAAENPVVNPDGSTNYSGKAKPLPVGVIGCGTWGREILRTLAAIPFGPVAAVCDTYPAYLRRGGRLAPDAAKYENYKDLLADEKVKGVIVATPTHQHEQVVLDALKAGKHVYCEAPLANSLEGARAIARAAHAAVNLNFQPGLQTRSDRQIENLWTLRIKAGVLGGTLKARSQYQQKTSWRATSPNPEREKEINWRLKQEISLGLAGELGIHQLDVGNWFFNALPSVVSGVGSLLHWKDGRDVADNVQAVLQYPSGVFHDFSSTIANAYNGELQTFYGTDSAILMRERHSWMFKEADAPMLGWEVYSRKDTFYNETGIVLGAGSTKQTTHSDKATPSTDVADPISPLQYALEAFLVNSQQHAASVADFTSMFGDDDPEALREYLADPETLKSRRAAATLTNGYTATITAIKTNEAIMENQVLTLDPGLFKFA